MDVAFSALKTLELSDMPALTHLWKGPTQLVRLRNLTFLKLERCDKLESMFSLSIARDLMQLEILRVSECSMLEVLISSEEEGDENEIASTTTEATDKIVFPKLEDLYLHDLPSFTSICKAMNGIELLQLNTLKLSQMPKLNSFCNTSDSNYDTTQPLFNKRACSGNGGQAGMGGGRNGLGRLVGVEMEKGLVGVGLQWEDEVDLAGGGSPEMLIADFGKGEGGERMGNEGVAFSALKTLELSDMPALTHLWKGPTQLVRLRNLTFLKLERCDKLESMFSLSIARDLMQLEILRVSDCRKLEVLISSEAEGVENEIASTTTEATDKIVFPRLDDLYLHDLPSFTAICKAMNGIELLQLNTLKLNQMPKLNSFCNTSDSNYDTTQPLFNKRACGGNGGQAGTGGGRNGLERLVGVEMEKGSVGVGLQWEDEEDLAGGGSPEMLIADFGKGEGGERMGNEGVAFSALKTLQLWEMPALTHLWKGPTQLVQLRNLTFLKLERCDKLESMFSLSIARDLMQLEILLVSECSKLEVLISSEEEGDENGIASTTTEATDKIVFPKLEDLYLHDLPSFTAICKAVNGIELLQLNTLKLSQMPKLISFCNTSDSNYDTTQPLFNKSGTGGGRNGLERLVGVEMEKGSVGVGLQWEDEEDLAGGGSPEMLIADFGKGEGGERMGNEGVAFSALKTLQLWEMPALTHLWKGPTQLVQLRNLTFLKLERCDKLESMFSLSIARDLMQLEILLVSECSKLEVLISSEEEGDENGIASTTTEATDKIVFPKLEDLYLHDLPSFTAICKAVNGIELLQLNTLKLSQMPKLNSSCNASDSNYDTTQPLFNKWEDEVDLAGEGSPEMLIADFGKGEGGERMGNDG
ncbi:unnamed protein product [Camellia sinensis]